MGDQLAGEQFCRLDERFCAEGSNCVEVGAAGDGPVRLRESAEPGRTLAVSRAVLGAVRDGRAATRR